MGSRNFKAITHLKKCGYHYNPINSDLPITSEELLYEPAMLAVSSFFNVLIF